jgi:hypothetical protein
VTMQSPKLRPRSTRMGSEFRIGAKV